MSVTPPQRPSQEPQKPTRRRRAADLKPETFAFYGRFTGWLLLALILSYIGLQLPLPYRLLAVVAGLAGVAGAIALLVQSIRRKLPLLMYISACAVLICCGMFALVGGAQTMFWQATSEFDECRDLALTDSSLNQCFVDYEDNMLTSIPGLR